MKLKIKRSYLYAAGAVAGLGVLYLLFRKTGPTVAPAVSGTVTSGSKSVTIDDNVLSENFGLVMPLTN